MKVQLHSADAKRLGLSALSGLLLAFSFPRFDWAPLALFALIPLYFAIHPLSPKKAALQGFTAGIVFYSVALSWVVNTMVDYGHLPLPVAWAVLLLLVAYLSAYLALFCGLAKYLTRGNPAFFFLLTPVLWTGLEYLRSTPEVLGFSWLSLGYSQYSKPELIQIAEFTGVYGVTALIVLVNSGLFYACHPEITHHSRFARLRWPVAGATLTVLLACWGYGNFTLKQYAEASNQAGAPLKVSLLQGNIKQEMKWDPRHSGEVLQRYFNLAEKAAQAKPDLIVWPEAATPFYFGIEPEGTTRVLNHVAHTGVPALIGAPSAIRTENAAGKREVFYYNSAYFIDATGTPKGRYDKIHLVPFGEFVPFRKILFFVEKMVMAIGDFQRGDAYDVFEVKGQPFGVNICYEIIFPDLVRQPVKNGARFLVNITNDAWFGRSAASYQHIAIAALRAVENRVPIVRAANTGITGIITADGTIHQPTELFTSAVVTGDIHPRSGGPTFYTSLGDVFSWFCLALTFILAFLSRMQLAAKKDLLPTPSENKTQE